MLESCEATKVAAKPRVSGDKAVHNLKDFLDILDNRTELAKLVFADLATQDVPGQAANDPEEVSSMRAVVEALKVAKCAIGANKLDSEVTAPLVKALVEDGLWQKSVDVQSLLGSYGWTGSQFEAKPDVDKFLKDMTFLMLGTLQQEAFQANVKRRVAAKQTLPIDDLEDITCLPKLEQASVKITVAATEDELKTIKLGVMNCNTRLEKLIKMVEKSRKDAESAITTFDKKRSRRSRRSRMQKSRLQLEPRLRPRQAAALVPTGQQAGSIQC